MALPPPEAQKRQLTRLCDLVAACLLPHLEAQTSPPRQLTREDERRVLLALSKLNKAIRGWNQEEEEEEQEEQRLSQSDQENVSCSGEVHNCCLLHGQHPYDGFSCLANMVSILIGILGFCSDYVKHSTANILVSISSALIKFAVFSSYCARYLSKVIWKVQMVKTFLVICSLFIPISGRYAIQYSLTAFRRSTRFPENR
nr:unnamed protein product [Digitaria exilis]